MSAALSLSPEHLSLADEIALFAAQLDAATHRLLTCIRRFDESEEWAHQGALSCAHWLTWRIGLDPGTAREKVRVSRALGRLPTIDAALARGEISYAKVRALTRVATPENEALLAEMAKFTTGAQLERICRRVRRGLAEIDESPPGDLDGRGASARPLASGLVRVELTLHPDEADLVLRAIDRARDDLRARPNALRTPAADAGAAPNVSAETSPAPTRADAMVLVAEKFLETTKTADRASATPVAGPASSFSDRPQLFIHLEQSLFGPDGALDAFLDDGTRVSAETFRRVSCDAALVPVTKGSDGEVLDIGRRSRVIPFAIRRALWIRDRGCRFPGCGNSRFIHGHHVKHWAHGGDTSLDNLVSLCSAHHRLVHEGGFRVQRSDDGELLFLTPRGKRLPNIPGIVVAHADDLSAAIPLLSNPDVTMCGWDGEPVDYDTAADAVIRESVAH